MKLLLGFSDGGDPSSKERKRFEAKMLRLRQQGIEADAFCISLNPPFTFLRWNELDARWRRGDHALLTLYEQLARAVEGYDVFVNCPGINLHPEFVRQLPTFNIYCYFDDPESSEFFSRPAAWAYDLALVGNIAEVDRYRTWGVHEARFWPLCYSIQDYDSSLTRERILTGAREHDVVLLCERIMPFRRERLDRLSDAFPDGAFYGRGWPKGFLSEEQRIPLYQQAKIGFNLHNSTGPVNARTYILPANGVMQLCDNKAYLGQIFELNKEVVGYDTIDEAIELCRYYLAHDEERRAIAAAGWERAMREYNEIAQYHQLERYASELIAAARKPRENYQPEHIVLALGEHRKRTVGRRIWRVVSTPGRKLIRFIIQVSGRIRRRLGK